MPAAVRRGVWTYTPYLLAVAFGSLALLPALAVNLLVIALCIAAGGITRPGEGARMFFGDLATLWGAALTALLLWATLSALWSEDIVWGLSVGLRILLLAVIGLAAVVVAQQLDREHRAIATATFIIALVVLIGLLIEEALSHTLVLSFLRGVPRGNPINTVARGGTVLAVLMWPALPWLATRKAGALWCVLLLAAAVVAARLLPTSANLYALGVGAVVFAAVYLLRRWALAAVFGLVGLYVVLAPILSLHVVNLYTLAPVVERLPSDLQHRLAIWSYAAGRAAERPLFGHGIDASRHIGRTLKIQEIPGSNFEGEPVHGQLLPLHPHNWALQIWLELGAVGIALFLLMLLGLVRAIARWLDRPVLAASAAASLAAFLFLGNISHSISKYWWLATGAFAAVALACMAGAVSPPSADRGRSAKS